ncbi:hypothetical protein ACLOJK_029861 [Asimina triloba]
MATINPSSIRRPDAHRPRAASIAHEPIIPTMPWQIPHSDPDPTPPCQIHIRAGSRRDRAVADGSRHSTRPTISAGEQLPIHPAPASSLPSQRHHIDGHEPCHAGQPIRSVTMNQQLTPITWASHELAVHPSAHRSGQQHQCPTIPIPKQSHGQAHGRMMEASEAPIRNLIKSSILQLITM